MIENLLEVEQALQRLIAIESEHQKVQSICRKKTQPWYKKISKTLLKIQQKEKQLIEETLNLDIQLKNFAQRNRKTWPEKILKLTCGTIGFRENAKVKVSKEIARFLLDLGCSNYVHIRRDADRKKMLELNEDILYQGNAPIVEDQFYVSIIKNGA